MDKNSKANRVYSFVRGKIQYLNSDTASTKATLAKLRRGVGKPLAACPESWGVIFDGLDEDLLSYDGNPSYAENAIWTALTLYAVHQQGKQDQMSSGTNSFGSAVRALMLPDSINEQSVRRRFNTVITAKDATEVSYHARGLIKLFKEKNIMLDYAKFSKDMYLIQIPEMRNKVLLKWGADSYQKSKSEDSETKEIEND